MTDRLKTQLAQALDVDPSDILAYSEAHDGSYAVILREYQKHTGVIPAPAPAPTKKQRSKPTKKSPAKADNS